jgi:Putative metal-binding motif
MKTTNGNFAVWKQEICPADCNTANYLWVGTSPGCTPNATCRPEGDYCNTNSDCCNNMCENGLCKLNPSVPDCTDNDKDGYGVGSGCSGPQDCNDNPNDPNAANIHPGATEGCDGIDNNCDGRVDEAIMIGTTQVDGCPNQASCVAGGYYWNSTYHKCVLEQPPANCHSTCTSREFFNENTGCCECADVGLQYLALLTLSAHVHTFSFRPSIFYFSSVVACCRSARRAGCRAGARRRAIGVWVCV